MTASKGTQPFHIRHFFIYYNAKNQEFFGQNLASLTNSEFTYPFYGIGPRSPGFESDCFLIQSNLSCQYLFVATSYERKRGLDWSTRKKLEDDTTDIFLCLADLSTSATVSGIFLFSVSGSMRLSSPATTEQMPKMITGMAA